VTNIRNTDGKVDSVSTDKLLIAFVFPAQIDSYSGLKHRLRQSKLETAVKKEYRL
jgi:hypothetical protein